jgi:hypothetical protein
MLKSKIPFIFTSAFIASAFLLLYLGCKHEPNLPDVCFESEILPIFQNNCTKSGCHNPTDANSDIILNNYDNIIGAGITKGNAKRSSVYNALNGGENQMPPGGKLSGSQLALIYSWIQSGAENTTGCGPHNDTISQATCDTVNVKYSTMISYIISAHCSGSSCHGAGADADFSTYALLHDYLVDNQQKFMNKIDYIGSQPMPPSGKLDSCALRQIAIWIRAGYPNN